MPEERPSKQNILDVDIVEDASGWASMASTERLAAAAQIAYANGINSVDRTASKRGLRLASVVIALSDDSAVRELNHRFRGIDKPTNVLSFPNGGPDGDGGHRLLGDVILARETVEREANELQISCEAHALHLVVHGVLHLLGYDHDTSTAAERMEALETACLAELGIDDPYAGLELADGPEPLNREVP